MSVAILNCNVGFLGRDAMPGLMSREWQHEGFCVVRLLSLPEIVRPENVLSGLMAHESLLRPLLSFRAFSSAGERFPARQ